MYILYCRMAQIQIKLFLVSCISYQLQQQISPMNFFFSNKNYINNNLYKTLLWQHVRILFSLSQNNKLQTFEVGLFHQQRNSERVESLGLRGPNRPRVFVLRKVRPGIRKSEILVQSGKGQFLSSSLHRISSCTA